MKNRLRKLFNPRNLIWILLQGVFLPIVWYSGKLDGTPMGTFLLVLYLILVYVDAVLTCLIFEPKDKA